MVQFNISDIRMILWFIMITKQVVIIEKINANNKNVSIEKTRMLEALINSFDGIVT